MPLMRDRPSAVPAPDPPFGGVIQDDALQSKPWWAPRIVPPEQAPNVLLIITDDAGFGVSSTFGGVIPTPAMESQTGQADGEDRSSGAVARRHPEAGSGHAQQQGERITGHFRGGEACAWGRRDGPESPA
jgi:hypothetical protein